MKGMVGVWGAWWVYEGHSGCMEGMVGIWRAWWVYEGHSGCMEGMVGIWRAWWVYGGHGGCMVGLGPNTRFGFKYKHNSAKSNLKTGTLLFQIY